MLLKEVPTRTIRSRNDDLIYVRQAVQAAAQKGLVYTRQPPEQLIDTGWGWVLDQAGAARKWFGPPDSARVHCHLVDLIEADPDFGVFVLVNREVGNIPVGAFAAVCPYYEIPAAARHLRLECLGETVNRWAHVPLISAACGIEPRPLNDEHLPAFAETANGGTLFRLDQAGAKTVWQYLALPGDPLAQQLSLHQLGVDFHVLYAARNDALEPARLIACSDWAIPSAERELKRWLKSEPVLRKLRKNPRS
jgi:hypothetical protein